MGASIDMKVKVFVDTYRETAEKDHYGMTKYKFLPIEDQINEFLDHAPKDAFVDIKFTTVVNSADEVTNSALVVWQD